MKVIRAGLLTTVQDRGRWGFQARGVPLSGAMDTYSHRLANRLAGNGPDAATLEVTLVGPHVEFESAARFVVAGAVFMLKLDGAPIQMNECVEAQPGSCLRFGERLRGARAYLAVAGGIEVPPVLNSRSTHIVSGMGGYEGRALRAGDVIEQGCDPLFEPRFPHALREQLSSFLPADGARVRVITGVNGGQLEGKRYRVSTQSDRMGYRLEGPPIPTGTPAELISSPVPTGAIQVPPSGQPILLMADHATVGGYPIAATVISADLPLAGQLAPGDWIEFEPCSLETADLALREFERTLAEDVR
jgi:antagonist of KipI